MNPRTLSYHSAKSPTHLKNYNKTLRNRSVVNDTRRPKKHGTPILESLDGKKLSLRQTLRIQEVIISTIPGYPDPGTKGRIRLTER
jgi:hypothetical protein